MSREDVEVVRQVFDAVGRRDAEGVLSLYDPNVELDISRTKYVELLGRGVYRGHKGLRKAYGAWFEAWENTEMYCEELIDAGEHVISVAGYRGRGRASGVQVKGPPQFGVWTIRDRRIVRVVWFETREEALEATGRRKKRSLMRSRRR